MIGAIAILVAIALTVFFLRNDRGLVTAVFLVRYPILTGLACAAIGPAGLFLRSILGNLLFVNGPESGIGRGLVNITWISLLVATTAIVMGRVTLRHAIARFELIDASKDKTAEQFWLRVSKRLETWRWGWGSWLIMLVIGLITPLCCLYYTYQHCRPNRQPGFLWIELLIGIGVYALIRALLLFLFVSIATRLSRPAVRGSVAPTCPGPFARFLNKVLGPGYTEVSPSGQEAVAVGHLWLLALAALTAVTYYITGILQKPDITHLEPSGPVGFPTVAFGLLSILLLGTMLSAMSFYLDRYRVPVVLVWGAFMSLTYTLLDTDHEYDLAPTRTTAELNLVVHRSPAKGDLKNGWVSSVERWEHWKTPPGHDVDTTTHEPPIIFISASGGGIQASAWAAKVLTALHKRYGERFSRSIVLISAVSGGSVGVNYYLMARREYAQAVMGDRWKEATCLPDDNAVARVNQSARASGLEAVGWGVLHPDLSRVLWPGFYKPTIDRGWALEQAWRREARSQCHALGLPPVDPRLSDLGAATHNGLPVVVYNSAISETGERLLMSSLRLRPKTVMPQGSRALEDLYPRNDIRASTAVRLSATFPFVSPMSRPSAQELKEGIYDDATRRYYVCDGGYIDTEGYVTVVECIRDLVKSATLKKRQVLVIRIQPFPDRENLPPAASGFGHALSYSLFGPIKAMLAVRTSSQKERNDQLSELFEKHGIDDLQIREARFVFEPVDPQSNTVDRDAIDNVPLNWKLTPRQIRAVDDAWSHIVRKHRLRRKLPEAKTKTRVRDTALDPLSVIEEVLGSTGSSAK